MEFTIDEFLVAKKIGAPYTGKRSSPLTIETYRWTLVKAERLIGKRLARFTKSDAMKLLGMLHEQSPRTRNKDVVALRQAFEWAFRNNLYPNNPFDGVQQAKVEDSLPRAISMEDAERIIDAVAAVVPSHTAEKYQLAFTLQVTSGLRISEVRTLRVSDVKHDGIVVLGKGSKQRFVPMRPDVLKRLQVQIKNRSAQEVVFNGESLRSRPIVPMTTGAFTKVFKAAVIHAGYDPNVITPHVLRHSFATHALRQTGRLEVVQDFLGHADPKTTRIYARLTQEDLKTAYQNLW